MSTILVATDFSPSADRALRQAIELARVLGDGLEVCHVHTIGLASVPPTLDLAPLPPRAETVARAETALVERAAWVREAGLPCETTARFGHAADEVLSRAAEIGPRLLVVGTHSGLRRALLGSVAQRILHHARWPVLVVPHLE